MNISGVTVKLTNEDIKSIIDDFVDIKGLNLQHIDINKNLQVKGSYKKIIKLPFALSLTLVEIKRKSILLKIDSASVGFISIFKWVRNLALKKLLKLLEIKGISFKEGSLVLDLKTLLGQAPINLDFDLNALELQSNMIVVEVNKVCINLAKKGENLEERVSVKAESTKAIVKKRDSYTNIRKKVNSKLPESLGEIKRYIMLLPDIIALFIRLFKDKRVPIKTKIICGAVIAYLGSPIDILPDFIPIIGAMDDFAIAFYALHKILCTVEESVIKENWQGEDDIIIIIRQGVKFLNKYIGANNISKFFKKISHVMKGSKVNNIKIDEEGRKENGEEDICN